jgi:hypothetical protein
VHTCSNRRCGGDNHDPSKCSKGYPRPFSPASVVRERAPPLYARPQDGRQLMVGNEPVDNRRIVPYNPLLMLRYGAHMNVEVIGSITTYKYIFKYIHKGPDMARVRLEQQNNDNAVEQPLRDEIQEYVSARYVSALEACWRLLGFELYLSSHAVELLQAHVEQGQSVALRANETVQDALDRASNTDTKLTAWFKLNSTVNSESRGLRYIDIPEHYAWNAAGKKWTKRLRAAKTVGRIPFIPPSAGETFYLRLLLNVVRGPCSFAELRTHNGEHYNTYEEACLARGLIDGNDEYTNAIVEAA